MTEISIRLSVPSTRSFCIGIASYTPSHRVPIILAPMLILITEQFVASEHAEENLMFFLQVITQMHFSQGLSCTRSSLFNPLIQSITCHQITEDRRVV